MVKYMNGLLYIDHKDPNAEILYGNAIKTSWKFPFELFDGDVINGDYITHELTDEILGKLTLTHQLAQYRKREDSISRNK